jgi:hypothetical protein
LVNPPRLALFFLTLGVPREYRPFVAGDLHEEFVRCGRTRGWYWRQVARSMPGFLSLHMRGSDWEQGVATFLVTAATLAIGWHSVIRYVCSQIPLKADPVGWILWRIP